MIQQIPLNGGLVTQVDGEEVSINACTELVNAEFDKPGLIYKRKGSATGVDTNKTFISIFRWVNPFFGITWIGLDSNAGVYSSPDLITWILRTSLSVADARIYNHGSFLRIAGGITDQPRVIQDIDRKFFYTDEETYLDSHDALHIGMPPKYPATFAIDNSDATKTLLNLGGGGKLPFATTAKSCFYKFTAVFDGNQELPFKDEHKAFAMALQDPAASNSNVQIRLKFDEDDWDPRITSINMYRAITDAEVPDDALYQKINTFATTQSTAANWIDGTGERGKQVFSGGTAITGVETTHLLYWNTSSTTLQAATTVGEADSATIQRRTITEVHPNHLYLGAEFDASYDYWSTQQPAGTTTYWHIRDETNLIENDNTNTREWSFESDMTGWQATYSSSSTATAVADTTRLSITSSGGSKTGTNHLKYQGTSSAGEANPTLQMVTNIPASVGEKFVVSAWVKASRNSGTSYPTAYKMEVWASDDSSASNAHTQHLSGSWIQFKVYYTHTSGTGFKIVFPSDFGGNHNVHYDRIEVNKVVQSGDAVYSGDNVFALAGMGADDNTDKVARVGATDHIVLDNITDVFKVAGTPFDGASHASIAITSAGDQWSADGSDATIIYLDTYDTGFIGGAYHPLAGVSSTEVNYKYSVITDGRQFVAGVRLDPRALSGASEDHDNWVIFSELNQYDILPISNYIQLRDLQGGAITGLSSLMGDLVVFMERGIYRLSVPSVDPTSWSLSESEENIGCIVDTSITSWESGVFFAGKDHLYFLDANFKAHPMTASIKDDYQDAVTDKARTFYDVKKNRLLCRFGTDGATIYSLDLSSFPEERWTQVTSGSGDMDIFTVNENLALYSYDESTQFIKLHNDTKSESTSFKRTTGWVSQANIDRSGVLRRFNIKYNTTASVYVGVKIYIDGDDTTAVQWPDGNTYHAIPPDTSGADWYKCKPSVRCRSYKIEIYESDVSGVAQSSTGDLEIRRLEVEFE